mmetsp:Transcript_22147/g.33144  ORF Transcript_22147/g.33144 Transcript_22147/m.33144 type:complete len:234 (+) Transcript_22147:807-1508(+)
MSSCKHGIAASGAQTAKAHNPSHRNCANEVKLYLFSMCKSSLVKSVAMSCKSGGMALTREETSSNATSCIYLASLSSSAYRNNSRHSIKYFGFGTGRKSSSLSERSKATAFSSPQLLSEEEQSSEESSLSFPDDLDSSLSLAYSSSGSISIGDRFFFFLSSLLTCLFLLMMPEEIGSIAFFSTIKSSSLNPSSSSNSNSSPSIGANFSATIIPSNRIASSLTLRRFVTPSTRP